MKKITKVIHGFSLMEVNLAVALIGVGLLALFSLFPMGLRESEFSLIDTHEAMFADHVLSCIRANAMDIQNYGVWSDLNLFFDEVVKDIDPPVNIGKQTDANGSIVAGVTTMGSGLLYPNVPVNEYSAPRKIRYRIKVSSEGILRKIELWVKSGDYGDFDSNCSIYFAEVFYMGM